MASGFQSVDCYAEDFQLQKKVGRMILGLKTGAKTQLTKEEKKLSLKLRGDTMFL